MKGIKFLLGLGFLSLLTTSIFAQDIPPKNQNDLITVCKEDKASKVCETRKNGKIARKTHWKEGKLLLANTYYMSGNMAKRIVFNKEGQLFSLDIYPDHEHNTSQYARREEYYLSFKNGNFISIGNGVVTGYFWFYKECKEDTPNGTKCNELNYFYPSSEPDLHPALALPIENQGLDVLKSNGIKLPNAF